MPFSQAPIRDLYVDSFSASLQARMLGGLIDLPDPSWRLLWVTSGTVEVIRDGQTRRAKGPRLAWLPWSHDHRLRALAGSVGASVLLDEAALANAIGHKPESADLRVMVRAPVEVDLATRPDTRRDIDRAFEAMQRELSQAAPGAGTIIEAQIRVLLVMLWREVSLPAQATRPAAQALQSFRQLVETHFRDRWRVEDYADALGMTRDRLHDLCRRSLGKPPSRLLHERVAAEAEALLVGSGQTVDQIADHLGFRAPAHFSRFFRDTTGVPPGAFRREALRRMKAGEARTDRSYADWP